MPDGKAVHAQQERIEGLKSLLLDCLQKPTSRWRDIPDFLVTGIYTTRGVSYAQGVEWRAVSDNRVRWRLCYDEGAPLPWQEGTRAAFVRFVVREAEHQLAYVRQVDRQMQRRHANATRTADTQNQATAAAA